MIVTLGIDPGNGGAVSAFENGAFSDVVDLPLMALGKKQQINPAAFAEIINGFSGEYTSRQIVGAYLEKVGAMPGQGVSSMFNFGMGYGVIQGVLAALGIPMHLVTPQRWKKHFGLIGKEKDCARTLAQQLYPSAPLSRKKDIGRADAILMGRYGLMQGNNQ